MRARLIDIANELGVSVNTVSLAIRGSTRVSEKMRRLVLLKADKMNYIPNSLSRSLITRKSNNIGVILRNLDNAELVKNTVRIEQILSSRGYFMTLMMSRGDSIKEIRALLSQQVRGILVYPDLSKLNVNMLLRYRNDNVPIVLMSLRDTIKDFDAVYKNRKAGAYKAVSHLASLGHKQIGIISSDTEKIAGYKNAVEDCGCVSNDNLIFNLPGNGYQGGYAAAQELFVRASPGMTAIFCTNDRLAIGALKYFQERGVSVPGDIALVGHDNLIESEFASVPLTTVTYDTDKEMGSAVDLLFSRIENEFADKPPEIIKIEPQLVIRQSCGGHKV